MPQKCLKHIILLYVFGIDVKAQRHLPPFVKIKAYSHYDITFSPPVILFSLLILNTQNAKTKLAIKYIKLLIDQVRPLNIFKMKIIGHTCHKINRYTYNEE